ncbi:MAG: hypothetical protein PVH68_01810 [Armatimonadota bacterium]|jgi:hypothetical protein
MSAQAANTRTHRHWWLWLRSYGPLLVAMACNLPGLRNIHDRPIADDHDTPVIVEAIREDRSVPGLLKWFARDWPLGNGFYRPVVVLSLAVDDAVYGDDARGYRRTSWLLAAVCSLGVYWLLVTLTRSPAFAACAGGMFALRQSGWALQLSNIAETLWGAAILMGVVSALLLHRHESRGKRQVIAWLVTASAAFVLVALDWQTMAIVVSWIAARTVLLGALFSVFALGSFAKLAVTGRGAWMWAAFAATCLALCSYEQSVMLPFAAAAILLWRTPRDRELASTAIALMGLALVVYMGLRLWTVGGSVTTYHLIQTKTSLLGPLRALVHYALPAVACVSGNYVRVGTSGSRFFMDARFWVNLALIAAWLLAYVRLCRVAWRAAAALWLVKALTFLPMAFLHGFARYLYLPEIAACALGMAALWPGGLGREES